MKRLVFWSILTCSLAANATLVTFAVRGRLARADAAAPAAAEEPCLFSVVQLDPAQKERVTALRAEVMEVRRAHAARSSELRVALAGLLFAEPRDQARIDALLAEIAGAQGALQRRVVDHILAVREVLRPEQRDEFEAMVTRHMRTGGPMMEGGR